MVRRLSRGSVWFAGGLVLVLAIGGIWRASREPGEVVREPRLQASHSMPDASASAPLRWSEAGRPVIDVEVGGRGLSLILDSGEASMTINGPHLVEERSRRVVAETETVSYGRRSPGLEVILDRVRVAGFEATEVPAILSTREGFKGGEDGAIGLNVFGGLDVTLDGVDGRVVLERGGAGRVSEGWAVVPLDLQTDELGDYYFAVARAGDGREVVMYVDTGADISFVDEGLAASLNGGRPTAVLDLGGFAMGEYRLDGFGVRAIGSVGFGGKPMAVLGADFFRGRVVRFSLHERRMRVRRPEGVAR